MAKDFSPHFKTPTENFSKEEKNKLASNAMRGSLFEEFRNAKTDLSWEAEQIAKSYGIYLEFNRAKTGSEKDWMYMVRVGIPGGGPISKDQWNVLDDLSQRFDKAPNSSPSIRLTTRQNVQFHWIQKEDVLSLIREVAHCGLYTLNGCGDNVRNVMACPLSRFSDVYDACSFAYQAADFFRLAIEPFVEIFAIDPNFIRQENETFDYGKQLLNRKFKIGFSTVHRDFQSGEIIHDNCVEVLTNDLGIVPVFNVGKQIGFQIYIGGGQGERNGKASMASLAQPLALVSADQLMPMLNAVVTVHKEWGDRENRHWARIKYLVKQLGIPWFRDRVKEILGYSPELPILGLDYGKRQLHHGWNFQPSNRKWAYGAFIENGRITDQSPNGRLKTMVRELVSRFNTELMITPNQDLLFCGLAEEEKQEFETALAAYGYGLRKGKSYSKLRLYSGACVGRDTCRLTYTDSEQFEPELIDRLEELGWGEVAESIGITGCERQCFRPATKSIGLVGSGLDRYQVKLMGTEDGKNQGIPVVNSDHTEVYLKSITREKVVTVVDALFRHWHSKRLQDETLGYFHRRVGMDQIISWLKADPAMLELMSNVVKAKGLMLE